MNRRTFFAALAGAFAAPKILERMKPKPNRDAFVRFAEGYERRQEISYSGRWLHGRIGRDDFTELLRRDYEAPVLLLQGE